MSRCQDLKMIDCSIDGSLPYLAYGWLGLVASDTVLTLHHQMSLSLIPETVLAEARACCATSD